MSNTTINMPVIKSVSDIDAHTVAKLYAHHGIDMPMYVECESNVMHPAVVHNDVVISNDEVKYNAAWYEQYRVVCMQPDVIVEEIVLTQYMSINVEYVCE